MELECRPKLLLLPADQPCYSQIMSKATQALLSFPPRELEATERELFDEWLSRAGDVSLAYVSDRRSDDPRFFRRIVIQVDPVGEQAYTIHATSVGTAWLVISLDQPANAEAYDTLRDALNAIRPVFI